MAGCREHRFATVAKFKGQHYDRNLLAAVVATQWNGAVAARCDLQELLLHDDCCILLSILVATAKVWMLLFDAFAACYLVFLCVSLNYVVSMS